MAEQSDGWTEQDLNHLLGWVKTGYFHTYPGWPEGQKLHNGCVELERRGLVRRIWKERGHVVWVLTDRKEVQDV